MEILQKYWYVVVAVIAVVFLLMRNNSGGRQLTQIGGASADTVALAQIAASEREADENRRYGLASSLMQFDLSNKSLISQDALARISLSQNIDLAKISAQAQTQALNNQFAMAQLQYQGQMYQTQQQYSLQSQAYNNAYNMQRRNDWISAITGGLQTLSPYLFGSQTSGSGGLNIPSIFGGSNGGWVYG